MSSQCNVTKFVNIGKKIICIGRNYSEHGKELGSAIPSKPAVLLKPTTSYITEPQQIKVPLGAADIYHEVELGIVIGKTAISVSQSEAEHHIAGYCLALDMTDFTLQLSALSKYLLNSQYTQAELKKDGLPWTLSKGFDTACPVGNFIPAQDLKDPHNVDLWCKVNGELRQNGNTREMMFSIPFLVSLLSKCFTLQPGDLVLTGTPAGVGPVKSGDLLECGLGDVSRISFSVE